MGVQPADAASRSRIRGHLRATLFVDAGAGTGKTTELVARIVALLQQGEATAPRLAAITFTDKAAAELRDRLRRELEAAAVTPHGDPQQRERCRRALDDLDGAAICTLHAFAQRVLASHPLAAGLPPGFRVLDDVESGLGFQDRWAAWLDGYLSDQANATQVALSTALGLEPKHLEALAWRFHENWDRLDPNAVPPALPELPSGDALLNSLRKVVGEISRCRDTADKLYQHLETMRRYLRRLEAAHPGVERLRVLAEPVKLTCAYGQQPNWPGVVLDQLRGILTAAEAERTALLAALRRRLVPHLQAQARGFALEWAATRRTEGALQFHDLLVLARNLLRDHPEVRRGARQQWTHLLIDEFQDTDPLQAEIAVLLAGDDVDGAGWRDATVAPGRLFFVGDPKQSIYRFRRADIDLYRAMQARFPGGETQLTQNFRSAGTILDWVNAVFGRLWAEDGADLQAPYVPLQAEYGGDDLRVRILGGPRGAASAEELREQEAAELVRGLIAVRVERWRVTIRGDAGRATRDARYGDIAILIPTRTALQPLTDALERGGVPYRIESPSLVFDSREIRELLAVLAAIDDATDQVALVAALRSPVFGCTDSALLAYARVGGRWNYQDPRPGTVSAAAGPVVAAFDILSALHRTRDWSSPAATVERVVRELQLHALAFAHRRPRDVWNRLRFLVDQARAYQEGGGSTLHGFVRWAERQAEENRGIVEMVAPEQDDDAVRIMTVHAAKGLDFPVVFLAGLNIQRQQRPAPPALWDAEGRVVVRLGAGDRVFADQGFGAAVASEQRHDDAEQHRLLYVGATRARDHLVVSLWHREQDGRSHAAALWKLCAAISQRWVAWDPGDPAEASLPGPDFEDSPAARARWVEARTELLADAARRPVVAATAVARAAGLAEAKPETMEELPPWRRGRGGTSIGRAVHSVLQTIDLETGAGTAAIAAAQAAAEGVPGRATEVERLVQAALASAEVRAAVASGRYWREVFVSAPVHGIPVEGFIDLLYETPEGYVVVDYKTDNLADDADLDRALKRYRLQGAAYALALQQALSRPVVRVVFVFVRTPQAASRSVNDLTAALAEVVSAVGALNRSGGSS